MAGENPSAYVNLMAIFESRLIGDSSRLSFTHLIRDILLLLFLLLCFSCLASVLVFLLCVVVVVVQAEFGVNEQGLNNINLIFFIIFSILLTVYGPPIFDFFQSVDAFSSFFPPSHFDVYLLLLFLLVCCCVYVCARLSG